MGRDGVWAIGTRLVGQAAGVAVAERHPMHQPTIGHVHDSERRSHGAEIELRTVGIGVDADPAVGHRKHRAMAGHASLVGADTMARPLVDSPPVFGGVPYPDHSGAILEPVLRGIEEHAVRAECTVTVEMPAGMRGESLHHTERLKRSAMRWTRQGGQAILTLRSLVQSQRFECAWTLLSQSYRATVACPTNVVPLRRANVHWQCSVPGTYPLSP